jgi:hypothetical protein
VSKPMMPGGARHDEGALLHELLHALRPEGGVVKHSRRKVSIEGAEHWEFDGETLEWTCPPCALAKAQNEVQHA